MELKIGNNRTVFYQWDSGQVLVVTGADTCEEVHFCSKAVTDALVCRIREENGMRVADVPNILLQAEMPITAYLFARREDGSETCCSRSFPVLRRPKPESYVYIQTEVLDYGNLDRRLAALEGDGMAAAVEAYLKDNPVEAGATAEEAAQIAKNKDTITQISDTMAAGVKSPNALTFTGAVSASYDGSKAVEVELPLGGGGGTDLEILKDITLEEAVMEFSDTLDQGYNVLEFYLAVPRAEGNTTNNNGLWCVPNGTNGWRFSVGQISIYGPAQAKTAVEVYPHTLFAVKLQQGSTTGADVKHNYDAGAISTIRIYPNISSESDMIPAGTRLIIRGRVDL